jgi:sialate O-acetylesterase
LFVSPFLPLQLGSVERLQKKNRRFKKKIRIACVGNSITYGGGLADKANEAYPAVLQKKLGEGYEVGNFGKNGATLLRRAPNAYTETEEFKKALAFGPDIVIIDLGINDTGLKVWPFFKDDFTSDYIDLIDRFRALDSKPEIWICTMTPYFNQSKRFKAALRDWYWEVQDNIHVVSESVSAGLIDLHTPLYAMPHGTAET